MKGSYSLVEPDGTLRVVEYTADDHTGFNAVVKRIGPALHPGAHPVQPIHAPIAVPIAPAHPIVTEPFIHPLPSHVFQSGPTFFPTYRPLPKPISIAKPIVVAEPLLPVHAIEPMPLPILTRFLTSPSLPVTISGATYGKKGLVSSWSSGPIDLDGRSLTIRHKH